MALRALTRRHSCAGTGQCLEATNEPTVGSVRRIEGVRRVVVQGHLGHLMATMAAKWVLHAALSRLFDVIEYARGEVPRGKIRQFGQLPQRQMNWSLASVIRSRSRSRVLG